MNSEPWTSLIDRLPATAIPLVMDWLKPYLVQIRISSSRRTKTGDYRPPMRIKIHRISVNRDLQPSAFLLTLTHEIAHMMVWERSGSRARPHGKEWKAQYHALLEGLFTAGAFPEELEIHLRRMNGKTRATIASDPELTRLLLGEIPGEKIVFLQDIPEGSLFSLAGGRQFIKKEKLRKRFRCLELRSKKLYLVSPVARVFPAVPGEGNSYLCKSSSTR